MLSRMRYMGIDYGSKRVGVALSDEAGTMGFPKGVVANAPHLLDSLTTLIRDMSVGGIVIGESKNLAGNDNPIALDARRFGDALHRATGIPVFYEDERFTSAEARRAPEAPAEVDASAAALILTNFLSKHDHAR